jgi:hypothetical protein
MEVGGKETRSSGLQVTCMEGILAFTTQPFVPTIKKDKHRVKRMEDVES